MAGSPRKSFDNNFDRWLEENCFSDSYIAEVCGLKSKKTVRNWRANPNSISFEHIKKLSDGFGVSMYNIIAGIEENY